MKIYLVTIVLETSIMNMQNAIIGLLQTYSHNATFIEHQNIECYEGKITL